MGDDQLDPRVEALIRSLAAAGVSSAGISERRRELECDLGLRCEACNRTTEECECP